MELEAGAGDVAAGALGVASAGEPVPVAGVELVPDGAAGVEYSSAVENELEDGSLAESAVALLEIAGLPVDEGSALGPGTSTWTFGGAPSGWGITMIGPTRTGPTCTGPTVIGAGSPSGAPGDVEEVARGAVVEFGDAFAGGGASACEVSAGGATSGREAVAEGAPVCCDVGRSFEAGGGWIGSTVPGNVDGVVRCRGCCRSRVSLGEVVGMRRPAGVLPVLGAGTAGSDDGSTEVALDWGALEAGG